MVFREPKKFSQLRRLQVGLILSFFIKNFLGGGDDSYHNLGKKILREIQKIRGVF